MPRLTIDHQPITVPEGTKVIDAAEQLGIAIPRFCYHPALGAVGACRMCAVRFVDGPVKGIQMSCMVDAADGMVVSTDDPEAVAFRRFVIECLMTNHPHDCPVCDEGGHCLLQDMTVSGGHGSRRFPGLKRTYRNQDLGPLIHHEMNRCIHCYRCVRFYRDYSGYRDFGALGIGRRVYYGRFADGPLESPFAGNLVDLCPTGVFTDKPSRYRARRWDLQRGDSICLHCGIGCRTVAGVRYREVLRQEARFCPEINGHFICDRGRYGFGYASAPDRPRRAMVDGGTVSRDAALKTAAERLREIIAQHGAGAVAAVVSPRTGLETVGMVRRLRRDLGWPVFLGLDAGRAETLRAAAGRLDAGLAASLADLEQADFILTVGADPLAEAPMAALAIRRAAVNGATLAVIDPRPVTLPVFERSHHLVVSPAGMAPCLGALVKAGLRADAGDLPAGGPAEFYRTLPDDCGLPAAVEALGPILAEARRVAVVCGTDLPDPGLAALAADLTRLFAAVRPWAGVSYLMPGPNAWGAVQALGPDMGDLDALAVGIAADKIKAVVAVEADLFFPMADPTVPDAAVDRLDLLVGLDCLPNETVRRAGVVFPTQTVFEAGGTYASAEGRLGVASSIFAGGTPVRQMADGGHPFRVYETGGIPGSTPQPAHRILARLGDAVSTTGWVAPAAPTALVRECFPDIDLSGTALDGRRVLPDHPPAGGFAPFTAPEAGPTDGETLTLIFVDATFGTEELSYRSEILRRVSPPEAVALAINPADAERAGLTDGGRVRLRLAGGSLEVGVRVSASVSPGIAVLPRHEGIVWRAGGSRRVTIPLTQLETL